MLSADQQRQLDRPLLNWLHDGADLARALGLRPSRLLNTHLSASTSYEAEWRTALRVDGASASLRVTAEFGSVSDVRALKGGALSASLALHVEMSTNRTGQVVPAAHHAHIARQFAHCLDNDNFDAAPLSSCKQLPWRAAGLAAAKVTLRGMDDPSSSPP